MSCNDGFEEFRWNCDKHGCFNTKQRLNFKSFFRYLPGKVSFSDVDGITEYNERGLMIEWKSVDKEIAEGQRRLFVGLTRSKLITVFHVIGDAETMSPIKMRACFGGKFSDFFDSDMSSLGENINVWAQWSKSMKIHGEKRTKDPVFRRI